jgi:hypothetical protein
VRAGLPTAPEPLAPLSLDDSKPTSQSLLAHWPDKLDEMAFGIGDDSGAHSMFGSVLPCPEQSAAFGFDCPDGRIDVGNHETQPDFAGIARPRRLRQFEKLRQDEGVLTVCAIGRQPGLLLMDFLLAAGIAPRAQ